MIHPQTTDGVRQLLGIYFTTMFDDIQFPQSADNGVTALSQFTREFGLTHRSIPPGSLFARDPSRVRAHDLKFIRQMFQHLPILGTVPMSATDQLSYLTEAQTRVYHRKLNPGYKGADVDSIWLKHDLMEVVFQAW
jgi:hypothetical protein